MLKYGFIAVEGPHDVEFVAGLLRPFGLKRVRYLRNLDAMLRRFVIHTFPIGDDLLRRHRVPLFLTSGSHGIAIHQSGGDSGLVKTVTDTRDDIDFEDLTGVGIILDSDSRELPAQRYAKLKVEAAAKGLALPELLGDVSPGSPRLGTYVLPNNRDLGTLEDLLLECGEAAYPSLFPTAHAHVQQALQDSSLSAKDLEDLNKPAGPHKAVIATVASVLRPGKSIQVSLQDNNWLRGATLALPRIKAVQDFLVALLELS